MSSDAHGDGPLPDAAIKELARALMQAVSTQQNLEFLSPGSRVDTYVIQGVLGRGGTADVYRAVDTVSGRMCALKLYNCRLALPYASTLRLAGNEVRNLLRLGHPNVVQIRASGIATSGQPYLVTDLVDGVPITLYCQQKQLGLRERVALFRKVCDAIFFAACRGIVHCDIKPGNLLVTADGLPKVIDFGLSREFRCKHATKVARPSVLGLTHEYASPEQLNRNKGVQTIVDAKSDVYSLGAVLYELLTGVVPQVAARGAANAPLVTDFLRTEESRAVEALRLPRPVVQEFARLGRGGLESIVRNAIAKERKDRYPDAHALANDLERWCKGRAIGASRWPRTSAAWRVLRPYAVAACFVAAAMHYWYDYRADAAVRRENAKNAAAEGAREAILSFEDGNATPPVGPVAQWGAERAAKFALTDFQREEFNTANDLLSKADRAALRCARTGQGEQAEAILDEAAQQLERRGWRTPRTSAQLLMIQALVRSALGDDAAALVAWTEAADWAAQEGKSQLPIWVPIDVYGGNCLSRLGRPADAAQLFRRVIANWPKSAEINSGLHVTAERGLAHACYESGDKAQSRAVLNSCLSRLLPAWGADHPYVLELRLMEAHLTADENPAAGAEAFSRTFAQLDKLGIAHSVSFFEARMRYSSVLYHLGDYRRAQEQAIFARRTCDRKPDAAKLEKVLLWLSITSKYAQLFDDRDYFDSERIEMVQRGQLPVLPTPLAEQMLARCRDSELPKHLGAGVTDVDRTFRRVDVSASFLPSLGPSAPKP